MPYKNPADHLAAQRRRYAAKRGEFYLYHKKYREENKEKLAYNYRLNAVKRMYNLGPEEYLQMILDQNNLCKICNKPESTVNRSGDTRPLCVDHCHTTGQVRGLLCNRCNAGLGNYSDDVEILEKAVQYLKDSR